MSSHKEQTQILVLTLVSKTDRTGVLNDTQS